MDYNEKITEIAKYAKNLDYQSYLAYNTLVQSYAEKYNIEWTEKNIENIKNKEYFLDRAKAIDEQIKVYNEENIKEESVLDVQYEDDDFIPSLPFNYLSHLLKKSINNYHLYFPYKIIVKKLNIGDNRWLKNVNLLGIESEDYLTLHVGDTEKIENIQFLWLCLHEFRHHMQYKNDDLKSATIESSNWLKFKEHMISNGYDSNTIDHVLHEIAPFEVDANIFANNMLGLKKLNSSFEISKDTLLSLEKNKKIKLKHIIKDIYKYMCQVLFGYNPKVT